jgi:hypothetical protein
MKRMMVQIREYHHHHDDYPLMKLRYDCLMMTLMRQL